MLFHFLKESRNNIVISSDLEDCKMATPNPTPPGHGEDNFVLQLKRIRERIKQKFTELIDCVKARECKLLKVLDAILASYHSYRDEARKQKEKQQAIEKTATFLKEELKSSPVKGMHETLIKQTENELNSIKFPLEPKMVHFVCDNSEVLTYLNTLGKLVEKVRGGVDYKSKIHPVVSVYERGNGMEQLLSPCGVTVDNKTGKIYIADCGNHCVKVFDSSGKILFKFGDSDGEGKMSHPRGLVISEDRILISNSQHSEKSTHSILIYQLNGSFVSRIGKFGDGKNEFNFPCGLACNESNGDIFICDSGNNRIQIFSKKIQFKSQFGVEKLKLPCDVKLSKKYIFILDESNPCLHLYDFNLILRKSVVSNGIGMQVVDSLYFFIDYSNNILISDCGSKSIQIFNPEFKLIHKIYTSTYPMGVVADNRRRVIVVCSADKECLQIF